MNYQEIEKRNFLTQVDLFKVTLQNTPKDKLDWKPDPSSMSPKEMAEHLAGANYFFASMIKGTPPPEQPENPPKLTFEQANKMLDESCQMMAKTLESVPDSKLAEVRQTPFGHAINVRFAMTIPSTHFAYHWGQLSYLQKQYGDTNDHFLKPEFPLGKHWK